MSYRARRRFLWVTFLGGLALALLVAIATNGTTLSRLSFEELAQKATAVARLRCVSSESKWDGHEIWTETRFVVIESNKGSLNSLVNVRMPGGSIGGLHSRVDGVPAFRPGEEAYVFLWAREGEPFRILGWSQGTFRIFRDARTGLEKVTQDAAATPIYHPLTREFVHEGIRTMTETDFRLKLKQALISTLP